MKEGWVCPRCGKVNAPFVGWCDCKSNEVVSNANGECSCGREYEWSIASSWGNTFGNGVTYVCKKCGQIKNIVCN